MLRNRRTRHRSTSIGFGKVSTTRGDNRKGVLSVKKEYPDPRTLPAQPSWQQPRPQVPLSELIPGQYVSIIARMAYVKTEKTDALGKATLL